MERQFHFSKLILTVALAVTLLGCGGGSKKGGSGSVSVNKPKDAKTGGSQADQSEANLVKSVNNAKFLGNSLQAYFGDKLKMPAADEWCDAVLSDAPTLAVFYSPQHPDTAKLMATLKDSAKPSGRSPDDAEPSEPQSKDALPPSKSVDDDQPPPGNSGQKQSLPKGERISHYALNKAMAGDGFEGSKVLVFECNLGWNGAGGLEDALKYIEKHKSEKIAVSLRDGRSLAVSQEELQKLKW